MELNNLGMTYDDMKRIVIKAISKGDVSQFANIKNFVATYAKNDLGVKETNHWVMGSSQHTTTLSNHDSNLVRQIVWDLIIERVLTIGLNDANPNWPFLSLTEYGEKMIASQTPILNDIDGVMKLLNLSIPNLDPVISMYMRECLNTYVIGATLASCVMLGCAAEKTITLLYSTYIVWLDKRGETKEAQKFKDMESKAISRKFDEIIKSINGHKVDIDSNVLEDMDVMIVSIFNIIRKNRNDAGHPTGNIIDKDELSAWIHVFRVHCMKIYQFINFFDAE